MARSNFQNRLEKARMAGASASLKLTANDIERLLGGEPFEQTTSKLRRRVRGKLKKLLSKTPAKSEITCAFVKMTKKNFCFQECDEYGNPLGTSRVGVLYIKKKFFGKKKNAPDFIRVGIFEWD